MARIAVVGASLAGLRAVESLRRGGWGDDITLIGAETHLPYDRPPLSKELLAGKWGLEQVTLRQADAYDDLDLDLRLGVRATGLNLATRTVALDSGEGVQFDGLL